MPVYILPARQYIVEVHHQRLRTLTLTGHYAAVRGCVVLMIYDSAIATGSTMGIPARRA